MNATASAAGFVPKRKKLLTRPVLKLEPNKARYIKVEAAMYVGKEIKATRGRPTDDEKKKEPATIMDVIDLTTGEPSQIVCNTVLKSTLQESYPNDGYVGLCFSVTKLDKESGKDYNKFKIEEIEDPTVEESGAAAAPKHTKK